MNRPKHEIELLLENQMPEVPPNLRRDIENRINLSMRHKTFWDNAKWLTATLGVLIFVVIGQLAVFQSFHSQLKEFSKSTLGSPEIATAVAAYSKGSNGDSEKRKSQNVH